MTREEKALLKDDNREYAHGIETMYEGGIWAGCCPFFINCGGDDCDEATRVGKLGNVTGCRGITCKECWGKPVNEVEP